MSSYIVAIALIIINLVHGELPPTFLSATPLRPSRWLSKQKQEEKIKNAFSIRGGASPDGSSDKVKGLCVGIDLGTTYRYIIILIVRTN